MTVGIQVVMATTETDAAGEVTTPRLEPVEEAAGVPVADADLEQAVGVTSDPLLSYGRYPRHDEYSEAHVARLASAALRHELYDALHSATQASVGAAEGADEEAAGVA
jgi:hypothetical protein